VDPILGPEMKSTGEVMGSGNHFAEAYAKSQLAAGSRIPVCGKAFLSVRSVDKEGVVTIARQLCELGFELVATRGTARVIRAAGMTVEDINKVQEGRPHIVDLIKNKQVDLIFNTTEGRRAIEDSAAIRRSALQQKVYYTTTLAGADAVCKAIAHTVPITVNRLQEMHKQISRQSS
jgi:carbamoyl-phosphate synthase large subunit